MKLLLNTHALLWFLADDPRFAAIFPAQLTLNHIRLIAIEAHHAAGVANLPLHHRDPFACSPPLRYRTDSFWYPQTRRSTLME
jgi:PIN domain nuclease of toxin-antitoxin system